MTEVTVVVTGMGLISALGTDLQTNWHRLLRGETGIRLAQPFPELPACPLGMIQATPTALPDLTRQILTATLIDAGVAAPIRDCGVVIGSSRGCQSDWERLQRLQLQGQSPPLGDWLNYLPNAAAIAAARVLSTQAPVLSPMAACSTGLWAIAQGYELLQTQQCQQVIVGAVEAPITPLTLAGFAKMGALAKTGAYPFDGDREGFVLGEGGALLFLETLSSAQERSANIYGQLLGFGMTADAEHIAAPATSDQEAVGGASIAAVWQCLVRSGRTPQEVGYIHAHGTGTQLNDQAEAALVQTCFSQPVALSSTKGATGHTLGASGALGAAFCLMALKHQILPPNVGLKQAAFDLDLVQLARPVAIQTGLCFSFGFGGQNAILGWGTLGDKSS
jgi:3-oxoacyl-[acyl-carrier-protein] synthase II